MNLQKYLMQLKKLELKKLEWEKETKLKANIRKAVRLSSENKWNRKQKINKVYQWIPKMMHWKTKCNKFGKHLARLSKRKINKTQIIKIMKGTKIINRTYRKK